MPNPPSSSPTAFGTGPISVPTDELALSFFETTSLIAIHMFCTANTAPRHETKYK